MNNLLAFYENHTILSVIITSIIFGLVMSGIVAASEYISRLAKSIKKSNQHMLATGKYVILSGSTL